MGKKTASITTPDATLEVEDRDGNLLRVATTGRIRLSMFEDDAAWIPDRKPGEEYLLVRHADGTRLARAPLVDDEAQAT